MPDVNVRVVDAWLEDAGGERVENVEQGEPIGIGVVFEARHDLESPVFGFHFVNADGAPCSGFNRTLQARRARPVAAGRPRADRRADREPAAARALLASAA